MEAERLGTVQQSHKPEDVQNEQANPPEEVLYVLQDVHEMPNLRDLKHHQDVFW
jgi:hypothetical protein